MNANKPANKPDTTPAARLSVYVNEHKLILVAGSEVLAHRYSIAGCPGLFKFDAYEPSSYFGPHRTLTSHEGRVWGDISSRPISAETDAIPVGPARSAACRAEWELAANAKHAAILQAWPEAASGERCPRGSVELWTEPTPSAVA